jgi:amidase
MQDPANALVSQFTISGASSGPLFGKTFVAKDLYDIAGHMTGCGNPDWARTHSKAVNTAPAVQHVLDGGATLVGKSHTDEIAYSLMGVNVHYGTPINTAASDRVPGGSSSGSVAAVAADMVDLGLGSDTGGSVRMPASFCGVYGVRTTHGRIDLADTMALAPSFDAVGWFAGNAATLAAAGDAYGIDTSTKVTQPRLLYARDLMSRTTEDGLVSFSATLDCLQEHYGTATEIDICPDELSDWLEVFRVCQAAEIWEVHGEWVTNVQPSYGLGVKNRFDMAAAISEDEHSKAKAQRLEIAKIIVDLIGDDGVILAPSSPGAAPLRSEPEAGLNAFRMAALEMLCPAGLAGLPQVSLPVGADKGAPLGLSLIGGRGMDGSLLAIAADGLSM